jgi:hypothetical protein
MDSSEQKNIIEIWKTVIGVQMHFNDIEMRIRSIFITLVLALCASIGFLTDKKPAVILGSITIFFVTFVPLLGVVATYLFYFIDRHWYHRLLVGAVKHAINIEKKNATTIPELSLSDTVGRESPVPIQNFMTRVVAALVVSDERYRKEGIFHSDAKIEFFYKSIVLLFSLVFLTVFFFGGVLLKGMPIIHFIKNWICSL